MRLGQIVRNFYSFFQTLLGAVNNVISIAAPHKKKKPTIAKHVSAIELNLAGS